MQTGYDFAVILAGVDRLIGGAGIYLSRREDREAWIGYCFNRRYWGQGYATEAVQVLLGFGFDQLGLHRIFATCDSDNAASAHILEKAGMQREGHLRENIYVRGMWRDSLLYAILETDLRSDPGSV